MPTFSVASTQGTEDSYLNFFPVKYIRCTTVARNNLLLTVQMTSTSNSTHAMIKSNYTLFDILNFSH